MKDLSVHIRNDESHGTQKSLERVSYPVDHVKYFLIWRSRHLRTHDDVHITCFSSSGFPFSCELKLRSWLRIRLYLKNEYFTTRSFYRNWGIEEKIEKWYLDGLHDIEIVSLCILIFSGLTSRWSLVVSPTEEIREIEWKTRTSSPRMRCFFLRLKLRKNILKSSESTTTHICVLIVSWRKSSCAHRISSELVILLSFFRIGKDLIRCIDFLELCFCCSITFIPIRMILERHFFICFFDLSFWSILRNSEERVVVFLSHRKIVSTNRIQLYKWTLPLPLYYYIILFEMYLLPFHIVGQLILR